MLCNKGVSQNYARKWHIPIDKLDFEYELLTTEGKTMLAQPLEGAYIYVRLELVLWLIRYTRYTANRIVVVVVVVVACGQYDTAALDYASLLCSVARRLLRMDIVVSNTT